VRRCAAAFVRPLRRLLQTLDRKRKP
jgi:hypothetical protein